MPSEPRVQVSEVHGTALLCAIRNGHSWIVHSLLAAGCAVDGEQQGGVTPLMAAAQLGAWKQHMPHPILCRGREREHCAASAGQGCKRQPPGPGDGLDGPHARRAQWPAQHRTGQKTRSWLWWYVIRCAAAHHIQGRPQSGQHPQRDCTRDCHSTCTFGG